MISNRMFWLAVAANVLSLAICALYAGGAPLEMALMPCLHILLFLLNMKAAKKWWQVIVLGLLHIAVTFCIHQQSSWLYFHYISDDEETWYIGAVECSVGVVWTSILFVVSLVWFGIRQKKAHRQ